MRQFYDPGVPVIILLTVTGEYVYNAVLWTGMWMSMVKYVVSYTNYSRFHLQL